MTARGQWMFDPNSGGKKIPSLVQADVEKRIRHVAEERFHNGRCPSTQHQKKINKYGVAVTDQWVRV